MRNHSQQTTLTGLAGDVLTVAFPDVGQPVWQLEQQFRQELRSLPRLDSQQEQLLIERARAGDTAARNELIISLLPVIRLFFHRLLESNYEDASPCLERMHLVQEGAKTMLEVFDRVRTHTATPDQVDNPCAFLLLSAYGAICTYCRTYLSPIRLPSTPGAEPFPMERLENPLPHGESHTLADLIAAPQPTAEKSITDYTPLYQAIEQLTERRKAFLIRRYGLYDHAPERLVEVTRSLYGDARRYKSSCHSQEAAALTVLCQQLQAAYPQYGTQYFKPPQHYTYERLALSDDRRRHLEEAEARIQARGERVTRVSLAREARMAYGWVAVYLHNRPAQPDLVRERVRQLHSQHPTAIC